MIRRPSRNVLRTALNPNSQSSPRRVRTLYHCFHFGRRTSLDSKESSPSRPVTAAHNLVTTVAAVKPPRRSIDRVDGVATSPRARAPEHPPRCRARVLAIAPHLHAVHEHLLHPSADLMRLVRRRQVH